MKKLTLRNIMVCTILFCTVTVHSQKIIYDTFNNRNWNPNKRYFVQQKRGVTWGKNYGYKGRSGGLRIKIGKRKHYGTSIKYRFQDHSKPEPTSLYAQYRVKYNPSFNKYFGKAPGFDGTYEGAIKKPSRQSPGGWGNKRSNGWNGWSARGSLHPKNVNGHVPNSFYVYHLNQKHSFGDDLRWKRDGNMKFNKWYTVRQYVKLNTPKKKNGVLKAWVNGKLVYTRKNLNFRKTPKMKIYGYWINFYHGGKETSPKNAYVFIDDFSLSKKPFKNFDIENSEISLYPNPITDHLKIDLGMNHKINTILIYDTTGREIENRTISVTDKKLNFEMNNSRYSKGIYVLKTIGEENINSYKLVKE